MARWLSTLLWMAVTLTAGGLAQARSLERFQLRVDTSTGKTRQLWHGNGAANATRPTAVGGARLEPAPVLINSAGLHKRGGEAVLLDGGRVRFHLPMKGDARAWSPWAIERGGVLTFAWRYLEHDSASHCHEVMTAAQPSDGRVLWQREGACHDAPFAAPLHDRLIVVDGDAAVSLIDVRDGIVRRAFLKNTPLFSMTDVGEGALIEAGSQVYLVDRATGNVRWHLAKEGGLIGWTPLARAGQALLQTHDVTALVDAGTGEVRWERRSPSSTGLWVVGDRIYEPSLDHGHDGRAAVVGLTELRLDTGAVVRSHVVQRYRQVFDTGAVVIVGVRERAVDLETSWMVFD